MPDRSEKYQALEASDDLLPFISKSKIMQWVKNPEHFRLKYIEGFRTGETIHTDKGTRIHDSIEQYYIGARELYDETGLPPGELDAYLPDDRSMWADFIVPHIVNFFEFEHGRIEAAPSVEEWVPVGMEEEYWDDERDPPWEGTVDAVFKASSVPQVDSDEGYVIVDWKTGSLADKKYRTDGIYMELEFYKMLFEKKYEPLHVGAFYTKPGEFIQPPAQSRRGRRAKLLKAAEEMAYHVDNYDEHDHFETKPGPLCGWDADDPSCRSQLYGMCPCTWNVPPDNQETFESLCKKGLPMQVIAEMMGTSADAVSYWQYKMGLR